VNLEPAFDEQAFRQHLRDMLVAAFDVYADSLETEKDPRYSGVCGHFLVAKAAFAATMLGLSQPMPPEGIVYIWKQVQEKLGEALVYETGDILRHIEQIVRELPKRSNEPPR
jgi:hypothetical protein